VSIFKNLSIRETLKWNPFAALDPAKPLYDSKGPGKRVDKSDADLVQVIHTSILGLEKSIGDADFYPNGGKKQPGCGLVGK